MLLSPPLPPTPTPHPTPPPIPSSDIPLKEYIRSLNEAASEKFVIEELDDNHLLITLQVCGAWGGVGVGRGQLTTTLQVCMGLLCSPSFFCFLAAHGWRRVVALVLLVLQGHSSSPAMACGSVCHL